ncbi:SPOC domain-like protein [Infundibulicybe gibba]|nr:SPOC domain-like protein [Infundibulicybe gibba]
MPAERAGYTVTMFLIDISPSMGDTRMVDIEGPDGESVSVEMSNLEWSLQFAKLKIQEMIFNGRKTDQCGVITFGSEETDNTINSKNGGYEHVSEYIPIGQPNAGTLAKVDRLQPSTVSGDPIDALIVGIETQAEYLASKKSWTRKIVLITDGKSPIELEDWEATAGKMNAFDIHFTIIGVDFDDEELPYAEPDKPHIKRTNETFFHTFASKLTSGIVGNCALALQETSRPDIRQVKSALTGTLLRLGDVETRAEEALEINVKTSKCTALGRPKSWKKYAKREHGAKEGASEDEDMEEESGKNVYTSLKMRSEYYVDPNEGDSEGEDGDVKMEPVDDENDEVENKAKLNENLEKVEKEQLVRGFKYGTTYTPCPDGQFPRLSTQKGIDICGFFPAKNFRRELAMGEIQYIWADPGSPRQQVALSSIVQAMYEKNVMAIARWVSRDGMDPKMGVLAPTVFDKVDCFLWSQMPFADDVRKYTFASLDRLVNKKGEIVTEHPFIPTGEQIDAMDEFVDAMDLMEAGERDEEGNRYPWFDTRLSYNPAIHRTKQAMFHCAIVSDIEKNPLPPPHPDLLKYFNPPRRVLKNAREAIEQCKNAFKIKQGTYTKHSSQKSRKARKDGHVHGQDDDNTMLLLDRKPGSKTPQTTSKDKATSGSDTEDDDDDDEMLLDKPKPADEPRGNDRPLPTPARSLSPDIDLGRAPGRIVGTTYPLADFQRGLAIDDLGVVITEIVLKPFTSRRTAELLECMEAMRKIHWMYDILYTGKINAWNVFLQQLRDKCINGQPGNLAFWSQITATGRSMSLISDTEAQKQGGSSRITDLESEEFIAPRI